MSLPILALVLLAAACHAGWNFLASGARGGNGFVWLSAAFGVVLWLPVTIVALVVAPGRLGWVAIGAMALSGVLHTVYFISLQRAYRDGDLSFVYPVARGLGPIVATLLAIVLLGERPGIVALAGGVLIIGSVLALGFGGGREAMHGAGFAAATGVAIGAYTVWDKHSVDGLALAPIVYYWGSNVANFTAVSLLTARTRESVRTAWRESRGRAAGVGAVSPLAYILVLFALTKSPVAYVAPARETSIVMATLLGTTVLAEGDPRRRLVAAGGVLAGVTLLALG